MKNAGRGHHVDHYKTSTSFRSFRAAGDFGRNRLFADRRADQFVARSISFGGELGKDAPGPDLGLHRRSVDRQGRVERVGRRALRGQYLRRLHSRSRAQVRRLRKPGEELRRRNVRISARHLCRPRRQCLGHRRPGQGRQGSPGLQVQSRRQGPARARQARNGRRRSGHVQRAVFGAGRAQWRYFCRRRTRRQHQFAYRQILQGRQVHQDLGKERQRTRRVRHAARAGDGLARTPVRRRPQQQPHPDLRSGRQVHRPMAAPIWGRKRAARR